VKKQLEYPATRAGTKGGQERSGGSSKHMGENAPCALQQAPGGRPEVRQPAGIAATR
jgi:hypothetical protein